MYAMRSFIFSYFCPWNGTNTDAAGSLAHCMVDQVPVVPVVVVAVVLAQWAPDPSAPPSVPAPAASVHSNRRVDVGLSVAAAAAMDVAMDLDPDPVDPVDPVDGAKAMEPELMPSQLAITAMMASEPEMPLEAPGGRGHRWLLVEFSGVSHRQKCLVLIALVRRH